MDKLTTPQGDKSIWIEETTSDALILQYCRNARILPNNGDDCEYRVIDTICGINITRYGIIQAILWYPSKFSK